MSIPTYKINRNQLVMLCDTNQSNACAELIMRKDKNGGVHSDWWGHPTTRVLMDGTTIVTLPCNAHNIGVLYNECGAEPDCTDEVTKTEFLFSG